jgi:hypothetical protein
LQIQYDLLLLFENLFGRLHLERLNNFWWNCYDNTKSKAFLNWMVVDEEFAGVTGTNQMNALQVQAINASDTAKQMV